MVDATDALTDNPLAFLTTPSGVDSASDEPWQKPHKDPAPSRSSTLPIELAALAAAGIERRKLECVLTLARRRSLPPAVVAVRSGAVSHQNYLAAIASHVGAHALSREALKALRPDTAFDPAIQIRLTAPVLARRASQSSAGFNARSLLVLAPSTAQLGEVTEQLSKMGSAASRVVLVTPGAMRRWLIAYGAAEIAERAENHFGDTWPTRSARRTVTGAQYAGFGALGLLVATAFYLWFHATGFVLHAAFTSFFSLCIGLRLVVLLRAIGAPEPDPDPPPDRRPAPVYTVLVAVHDEANQADDLVAAMGNLHWPSGRLEIKFITESDDQKTIVALRLAMMRQRRAAEMEVLVVPDSTLRTKPRALNFALPITRGEYVVLYDAEDRPDPGQLLEAHGRFAASDQKLACLQSPLAISNGGRGFLSMMFALEYAALFKVFLPAMARMGLPFPLGGTSNHFRRAALEEVGAWDPHNVTEDADLGLRLARYGYRSDVMQRPTFEEAPVKLGVWVRQRTRWLKGWAQTWLIHLREPLNFVREAGAGTALVSMVLFGGTLLATLLHPWIYVLLFVLAMPGVHGIADGHQWLVAVDVANILVAFIVQYSLVMLAVHRAPWVHRSGHGLRRWWPVGMPVYWLLATLAAWRAVWQLITNPHKWEKTPHGL
ncbi:MAG: glycosyltransferase family 2 protein [Pseudomonadota bacterium]